MKSKKNKIKIIKKNKKLSSIKWLNRHFNDEYVKKASNNGYRSRSAYKLIEIDNKFKLFQKGIKVIDLGAYPGSWSQVASQRGANVFAIDIKSINKITGVRFIKCNIIDGIEIFKKKLKYYKFDIILSDMSPESCGLKSLDHIRIMSLCEAALNFVNFFLKIGGKFVIKIFHGEYDKDFFYKLKKKFKKVEYFKPKSSRHESREIYLVNLDFIGYKKDDFASY